ncbi:HAD family hydrolase [Flavivirga aquimarina]|uniref:phosphoglycolate phosphatase n=1 Tax=Flavivirga aquimarina TaxID=2027862 RepID=A0ABT8W933_9FLAO|nr:HAD family hydrolase [Flavivirga aquimarina]MDO5969650.1 HAD family hydrolase [Flavivirga aquimarina]
MTYKAIIFDLDGTLVNSIEDLGDSMNLVLDNFGYPTHNYKAYNHFVGSGIKNLVIKALPETHKTHDIVNTCFNAMMDVYSNNCTVKTKPYDGILELLNQLKSQKLKLSVLSNKSDILTKKVVSSLLPNYFHPVFGLTKEVNKKPNPIKALEISETLNIKPENIIFVGDTNIDIQTAKNANMLAVGVTWGFRDKKELIESGAKYILNHPTDLLDILHSKKKKDWR